MRKSAPRARALPYVSYILTLVLIVSLGTFAACVAQESTKKTRPVEAETTATTSAPASPLKRPAHAKIHVLDSNDTETAFITVYDLNGVCLYAAWGAGVAISVVSKKDLLDGATCE